MKMQNNHYDTITHPQGQNKNQLLHDSRFLFYNISHSIKILTP